MGTGEIRIGVVATASRASPEIVGRIEALGRTLYPAAPPTLVFHPDCFASHGHFAGDDATRAAAFLDIANDESFDALWFARGGYGSCRVAEAILAGLRPGSRRKAYLGYSDAGTLLAALYGAGYGAVAHGPVAQEILREGGEAAAARALSWLVERSAAALEPTLRRGERTAAFNITILSQLLGTPLQPDLDGHVLMLEEVSEHMYRIDRSLFHITSNPGIRRVKGIRLGRCSRIPPNDVEFGMTEEEVARFWCDRSGIPWLGRADIGHDTGNRIVPFGPCPMDAVPAV